MSYIHFLIVTAAICVTGCSKVATPEQQAPKATINQSATQASANTSPQPPSADIKNVAKAYNVTEEHANDVASRAAQMTDGKASKQDMIDALKAARGQ